MKTIKGPAIFLAQFVDNKAPFNSLDGMCKWAANLGYKGIQIPTWENFLIDLDKASESQTYCDELKGCLLYTSPSPRDPKTSRMPSSA